MMEVVAGLQLLFIGAILLWSGSLKLFLPGAGEAANRSALPLLLRGERRALVAYRTIGVAEVGVALFLLLPPAWKWEMGLAVALAVTFVAYLLYSYKVAPDRPCGCLGGSGSEGAISWRGFTRAGLLVLFGVLGLTTPDFWFEALIVGAPWSVAIIVLEAALLLVLSPELDEKWASYITSRAVAPASPANRLHFGRGSFRGDPTPVEK